MTAFRNFKPITGKKKVAFLQHITQELQKTANVWDSHFTDKKAMTGTDAKKNESTQNNYYLLQTETSSINASSDYVPLVITALTFLY